MFLMCWKAFFHRNCFCMKFNICQCIKMSTTGTWNFIKNVCNFLSFSRWKLRTDIARAFYRSLALTKLKSRSQRCQTGGETKASHGGSRGKDANLEWLPVPSFAAKTRETPPTLNGLRARLPPIPLRESAKRARPCMLSLHLWGRRRRDKALHDDILLKSDTDFVCNWLEGDNLPWVLGLVKISSTFRKSAPRDCIQCTEDRLFRSLSGLRDRTTSNIFSSYSYLPNTHMHRHMYVFILVHWKKFLYKLIKSIESTFA